MSLKAPILDEAATEALFIGFLDGRRTFYEHCWDRCQRRTSNAPLLKWERLAIWLYSTSSGFWYKRINDPLRARHTLSETAACVAGHLADGLEKLPQYRGRAYRGVRVPDLSGFLADYAVGNVAIWRAFNSASATEEYAVSGNVQFMIASQNGKLLGDYADLREEQEVLFPPGTRVRVLGLEQHDERAIIFVEELAPQEMFL